jgi:hypothetical protein
MADEALIIDNRTMLAAEPVPLEEVSLWHIDPRKLCDSIRSALGIDALSSPASLPGTHCVGMVRGAGGETIAAFLVLAESAAAEVTTIGQLLSAASDPILILTPTGASWSDASLLDAKRRGCALCPLSACLEVRERRLAATNRWTDHTSELLARARARAVVEPRDQSLYRLRKQGKVWTMTFAGRSFPLQNSLGVAYLCEIVRHPYKPREFMECVPQMGDHKARARIAAAESHDPRQELRKLRDARSSVKETLAKAQQDGNTAIAKAMELDLEQINNQIGSDKRLAKARRRQTAEHRSACNAFKQAVERTIAEIARSDADAGHHFTMHLKALQTVTYTPPQGVTWEV